MNRKDTVELIKKIEACKERIATERDKLRDLENEVNEIVHDCDEADIALQNAVDSLSRLL